MKKYIILLFGLFLLAFVPEIHAQPQQSSGLRFACLDAEWCNNATCPSGSSHVHRTALSNSAETSKKAVPGKTYITECVEVKGFITGPYGLSGDIICTTGNSDLDKELFCDVAVGTTGGLSQAQLDQCDHYARLKQPDVDYKLDRDSSYGIYHLNTQTGAPANQYVQKNINDPSSLVVQANGSGVVAPMEWQSYTEKSRMRKFLFWNKIVGTQDVPQDGVGQKQADLPFVYRSSLCSGNSYDPYGKAFDMMTLEPIPDVQISLKQYDTASNAEVNITIANPNIVNPFFTGPTGHFAFVVVDGNYVLSPVHPDYTHAQTTDAVLLPINASRIYSDFYYTDSPVIRQRGAIQHRDVVMKPNNGTGNTFPLVKIDEFTEEKNGKLIYSGYLSHPFVLLSVEICTPGATAICTPYKEFNHRNGGPDKMGKFSITLDQSALQIGQYFNMKFTKQDLTTATLTSNGSLIGKMVAWVKSMLTNSIGVVQAQDSNTLESKIEPIPVYLEGYAYDNEGNIMQNATVGVYVSFSEAPMYQMNTDSNGYFRITSEYIPATEYSIRFTSTNDPNIVSYQTTSQLLANNKSFIEAEKINPYKFASSTTNPRRNVTPSFVPQQKISPLVTEVSPTIMMTPSGTEEATTTTTTSSKNPVYLIGAMILILIGGVGVMLAIYVYKKRSSDDGMSKTNTTE